MEKLSDWDLLTLRRDLRIQFDPLEGERPTRPRCWQSSDDIRLFVSHKSERELYAGQLSNALLRHGFSGFVARYHISVGEDWSAEVARALFSMQVFISIHTVGMSAAGWPMQEVGVAFGRKVPMLALVVDEPPGGLLHNTQAMKISFDLPIEETAEAVAHVLKSVSTVSRK